MDIQGTCISSTQDEHGPIYVYQNKNSRILSFDGQIYQSCMKLNNVNGLNLGYTQAMMAGFLFISDVKKATVMGLGAGSMVKNLLSHFPELSVQAVEYREAVVQVAKEHFELPDTTRLSIHVDDAVNYIKKTQIKSDIIFSDLYSAKGMEIKQIQLSYLRDCKKALNDQGVLVLNVCHTAPELQKEFDKLIAVEFNQQLLCLTVNGGNRILFAFKNKIPFLTEDQLLNKATLLQDKINIPMMRYAKLLSEIIKKRAA